MERTSSLLGVLQEKNCYKEVLDTGVDFVDTTLSEYLQDLITLKNLKKAEVISRSGLDRVYAYQMLSGTKKPTRDKLLALAVGMNLIFDEVQQLLKVNGYAQLYPKNKRDSIIIFAIYKGQGILELNDSLLLMGEGVMM